MSDNIRSDYIIMSKMIRSSCPKLKATDKELNGLSELFIRLGGSWIRIFNGSNEDLYYLRKLIKNYSKVKGEFIKGIRKKRRSRI